VLQLLLTEFKRTWTEFIRYPIEAIAGLVITTFIFYGLFLSARFVAGSQLHLGDRLSTIVVGYVLWTLVLFIVNDIAATLQMEAQTGTLEQIFLSPFGAPKIFLVRTIANLGLRLALILGVLFIIMLFTQTHLHFSLTLLLPLSTLLLGAYGMSFMMGALALVFKRVEQLLGFFRFGLLFLLAVPIATWIAPLRGLGILLPMATGAEELRNLMVRNQSLSLTHFMLALLNGIGYFALGLLVFKWAERQAKRQGILSGY